ncbi:HNH endonuclease [Brachybacterium sp. UNK5269]|uniref:HNH endonuclease signature motif containing protein n=1 Tax=Brachybacterium sp. UNK5269 TaxID=3408576 RepID=UPI003BAF4E74
MHLDVSARSGAHARRATARRRDGAATGARAAGPLPGAKVRARSPLTEESLITRGGLTPGSPDAAAAVRLMESEREASRSHAARLLDVAAFWIDRSDPDLALEREELDLAVAIALRTTTAAAGYLIKDAHIAVAEMPRTFERLAAGDMPTEWHQRMLKSVRDLTAFQRSQIDERIALWDLPSIPADRFRDELRLLVAWYETDSVRRRPEESRDVALDGGSRNDGTACLRVTGPIPEILAVVRRLDAAAKAVQAQQRHALEADAPIPFDLDGDVGRDRRAMTLAALRYAILQRTVLDTAGVSVPAPRHRVNVVIPVLTLMGLDDAPATYDGVTPLPADMARRLAAAEPVWHRVFTNPITGAFLPLPAEQYRPTAAMVEHLRLLNPRCAVPGCTKTTADDAENDHIEEFDHECPARGGPTEIENLHRLDWHHHDLKTARRLDPHRHPDGSTTWSVGSPPLLSRRVSPQRDLLTPAIAAHLVSSWEHYLWTLELEALERAGELDRLQREWGPPDPAQDGDLDRELDRDREAVAAAEARRDLDPPF